MQNIPEFVAPEKDKAGDKIVKEGYMESSNNYLNLGDKLEKEVHAEISGDQEDSVEGGSKTVTNENCIPQSVSVGNSNGGAQYVNRGKLEVDSDRTVNEDGFAGVQEKISTQPQTAQTSPVLDSLGEDGFAGVRERISTLPQMALTSSSLDPLGEDEPEQERRREKEAHSPVIMFKSCPSKINFTENRLQAGDVIEDEESAHVRTGEPQVNSDNDTDDPLHSIDLNSEPVDMYGWQEIADEEIFRRGKSKKAKNKDKKATKIL
ncbi:hypothetical protein L2E82_39881 [Cichorium intybus]|uniref:Uncharacterized protein n=1 Tax=Cichorium intybus TaxID=13427 RepID=A0ACB9AIS5_CICIN|nr:hypothetical protein L2E82_39881 [Cichorium intybus]